MVFTSNATLYNFLPPLRLSERLNYRTAIGPDKWAVLVKYCGARVRLEEKGEGKKEERERWAEAIFMQ